MVTVTADSLNIRPDPSTNRQPIGSLSRGQKVEVLKEQNNWLQVKLPDGRVGWVSGAYVDRHSSSPSPSSSKGSLSGKVIVLDPGHGGHDPGAVGVTGLREKDVVLDVALRAAKQLRAKGAKVVMTRDTDVFIPLTQRVAIAEAAGANVFVSVHANAYPSAQIGGTETYYYGYKASSGASRDLATHIQRRLVGSLGLRDIGVKDANFLVIRQTSMPSTLLELGFLSNAHEESLMRTDEFRQNAADGIVRGLLDYFK
jgi:N-acetylmuramoyl-L-alanine amidase